MKDMPRVSVVTVSYNSSATIRTTFESIMKQDYRNLEYIVVDGNSTDSTLTIIKEYENKFAAKGIQFKWISEPDKGIFDAMNKGVLMATGDYIGIINSDDWYEANVIKKIAKVFIRNPDLDMVFGNLNFYKENEFLFLLRSSRNFNKINKKMCVWHPTMFINKSVYKKYGLFDAQFKTCADWDFILRIHKRIKFKYINAVIANMRLGGVSSKPNINIYVEEHAVKKLNNSYRFFDFSSFNKILQINIFGNTRIEKYYFFRKKVKIFLLNWLHKYL